MRPSERALAAFPSAVLLFAALGCVVKLDHEFDQAPIDAAPDAPGVDAAIAGCRPFPGVRGDVRSLSVTEGALFVTDDGRGFLATPSLSATCGGSTRALGTIVTVPSIADAAVVAPLDLVAANDRTALFLSVFAADASAPFGLRALGGGVAFRDASSGTFAAPTSLLWSGDRPGYGESALRLGEYIHAYGCKSAGAFEEDCYVARAPVGSIDSTAAYEYWTGSAWSADVDAAAPIVRAGSPVSVRAIEGHGLVMTYVPPLGSTIVARTSIAPEGPWSAATTLAACDLSGAGTGAFCSGGRMHVEIDAGPSSVALTYAAASFDAGPCDAGSFDANCGSDDAFSAQLVVLPLP